MRRYGYSGEEFLGMTILDVRSTNEVIPLLRETLGSGRHDACQEKWGLRTKNGKVIDI